MIIFACQCPQRAYFHFYDGDRVQEKGTITCVNALNGLTFISTVASRNP